MNTTVHVPVRRLHPKAKLPTYAHTGLGGDLAADLHCVESVRLAPGDIALVSTGLAAELPHDYGALIEDRSGLALEGLCTLGGVIDPAYRGEIKVVVANLGRESKMLHEGDRIAQLRLVRRIEALFVEVEGLSESLRGEKGFGSTGN